MEGTDQPMHAAIVAADAQHSDDARVLLIGLFEPDPVRAVAIIRLLDMPGRRIIALGDPALSVRDWLHSGFDVALVNPFVSAGDATETVALCRRIAVSRPLFALTLRDCPDQRTLAIAAGADDAIEPMRAPQELVTRLQALLRRRAMVAGQLACDELQIDLIRRSVQRGDRSISMPGREFELLAELARTPDEIVPRPHLLRSVWRLDFDPGTNRVEVHMSRLRRRLDAGEHWPMLRTFKGRGYALVSRHGLLGAPSLAPATMPARAHHRAPLTA
jgi:two-component system, OmpR family, response regulator